MERGKRVTLCPPWEIVRDGPRWAAIQADGTVIHADRGWLLAIADQLMSDRPGPHGGAISGPPD